MGQSEAETMALTFIRKAGGLCVISDEGGRMETGRSHAGPLGTRGSEQHRGPLSVTQVLGLHGMSRCDRYLLTSNP